MEALGYGALGALVAQLWSVPSTTLTENVGAQVNFHRWQKIDVPEAVCGNGDPYHFYFREGRTDKVAITLMGGGACWSRETCVGKESKTTLSPPKSVWSYGGFTSRFKALSPVSEYAHVWLPYCTGDVHLGGHDTVYDGLPVKHRGWKNIQQALAETVDQDLVQWSDTKQVVLYGFSAGAIGALMHTETIDQYLPSSTDRVLIPDAPGLHFGNRFWSKFTPELRQDYFERIRKTGAEPSLRSGLLTDAAVRFCEKNPNWRVGILQGSKDYVMSTVFGDITPEEHENLVYGPRGIFERTRQRSDNCQAWVPATRMHTFMVSDVTSAIRTKRQRKTGRSFIFDLVKGRNSRSYR